MKRLWNGLLRIGCLYYFSASVAAGEVQVAVASNFSKPMTEIAALFREQTGHEAKLSFGSSGKFTAQIRYGAPFEVFLSADTDKPAVLIKSGLADPASVFTYAQGALALWSANPDYIKTDAAILKEGDFRHIALATPELAPYGIAAEQVLQHLALTELLKERIVMGENISQAFQFVQTGNAELGFVAVSQIMRQGEVISGSAWIVPPAYYQPIKQDAVLLKKGLKNPAATELLDFLRSEAVNQVLRAYGYTRPEATEHDGGG